MGRFYKPPVYKVPEQSHYLAPVKEIMQYNLLQEKRLEKLQEKETELAKVLSSLKATSERNPNYQNYLRKNYDIPMNQIVNNVYQNKRITANDYKNLSNLKMKLLTDNRIKEENSHLNAFNEFKKQKINNPELYQDILLLDNMINNNNETIDNSLFDLPISKKQDKIIFDSKVANLLRVQQQGLYDKEKIEKEYYNAYLNRDDIKQEKQIYEKGKEIAKNNNDINKLNYFTEKQKKLNEKIENDTKIFVDNFIPKKNSGSGSGSGSGSKSKNKFSFLSPKVDYKKKQLVFGYNNIYGQKPFTLFFRGNRFIIGKDKENNKVMRFGNMPVGKLKDDDFYSTTISQNKEKNYLINNRVGDTIDLDGKDDEKSRIRITISKYLKSKTYFNEMKNTLNEQRIKNKEEELTEEEEKELENKWENNLKKNIKYLDVERIKSINTKYKKGFEIDIIATENKKDGVEKIIPNLKNEKEKNVHTFFIPAYEGNGIIVTKIAEEISDILLRGK